MSRGEVYRVRQQECRVLAESPKLLHTSDGRSGVCRQLVKENQKAVNLMSAYCKVHLTTLDHLLGT